MKIFRSIRWRLQFWYGLFLLLLLGGFGLAAYRVEQTRQFGKVDEELRRRAESLNQGRRPPQRPAPGSPPPRGTPPPPGSPARPRPSEPEGPARPAGPRSADVARYDGSDGFYFVIWLRNGTPMTRSDAGPAEIPRPGGAEGGYRQRGEFREYFLVPAPEDYVLVGRSIAADLAELQRFAWRLAAAGAGVLVAGLLGGWWLVSRALKPVEAISMTAVKIAAGDLSQRIAITSRDSELDDLAEVLNSTFKRLDDVFAQQARFTADAAHELRTPVTVMLTHTQSALETTCPASEHHEALAACQRAAQRMRRLIESLLELARFDAGNAQLRRQQFDLADIAAGGIELVQPLAARRRITIHQELGPVSLPGDPDRIGQVITNLLGNAIHYNLEGGEIRVTTWHDGTMACLSVADHGPGIPPEHLPHIFERFYRADKARTSTGGGTGLGLAICKAVVEAHGGTIKVRSQPGAGTTFTMELPAQTLDVES